MIKIYQWVDINGKPQVLLANSVFAAKQTLLLQGDLFLQIKQKGYINKQSFKRQELVSITRQLATMIKAGLPLVESLALLADEHPILHWQYILNTIKKSLIQGESLSQAIAKHPSIFPALYKEVVATGELTGQLDHSFEQLADQLEKTLLLQKRIKKALRYPVFLLAVSMLVTVIMLLVVLPKFAAVYQSFDAQLPAFTQGIIYLSELLQDYFILWLIAVLALYLIYSRYIQKKYRKLIDKGLLKTPILGNIVRASCLTQIFQTLSITQQSGIPLLAGLSAAQAATNNSQYKNALFGIIAQIEQGHAFSHAIQQYCCFPNLCTQLIRVGEESGTLETMLSKLAEYYQLKSKELAENLSQKIEPLMMSIMAIIVGSLVIAMYLPIFQLGNVIH